MYIVLGYTQTLSILKSETGILNRPASVSSFQHVRG